MLMSGDTDSVRKRLLAGESGGLDWALDGADP